MKKITYNIRTIDVGELKPIDGFLLEIPPFKFGVRHEGNLINKDLRWEFTELESGYIFLEGNWGESRKSVIEKVKKRINKYGVAEIKRRIVGVLSRWAVDGKANT